MNLSVIGLGKLGSPMLAVFVNAGFYVVGVDLNPEYVMAINAHRAPVQETDLQDYLDRNKGGYRATGDTYRAVLDTDATFVIVPTPTGDDGGFVLDYVLDACKAIGAALRDKDTWHLVVVTSTVMPGHMRKVCAYLEEISGKREGDDFGLCYSPEFIALGSVIHDFTHPDYALIGCENDKAGAALESIYGLVHRAPKVRMNWVNAEIAKIAQNSYITMKITFANQLAQLCGHIPGANVDEVTCALGHDSRIGSKYLKGGTAFGGPCFPRDNRALFVASSGTLDLAGLIDEVNESINVEVFRAIADNSTPAHKVGVLGLAYKPATSVIEESASIKIIQSLINDDIPSFWRRVIVYDPLAMDEARKVLGDSVEYAGNAAFCINNSDIVVLMHPDRSLLDISGIFLALSDKTLIDPWRVLDTHGFSQRAWDNYIPLGIGPREAVTA